MKRLLFILTLAVLLALPFKVSFGFEATPGLGIGMLMQSGHDSKLGYDVGIDVKIADAGKGWAIRNITSVFYSDWNEGEGPTLSGDPLNADVTMEIDVVRNMTITQKSIWYKSVDSVMVWDFHIGLGSGVWEFRQDGENETHQAYEFQIGGYYKGMTLDAGVNAIRMPGPDMYYFYGGLAFNF